MKQTMLQIDAAASQGKAAIDQEFGASRRPSHPRSDGTWHSSANLWRRFRKGVFAVMIVALIALAGGMVYESIGRMSDARRLPVRGRMVDIGGYRLNINCTGTGSPTVILDSGLGEPALSWKGVQAGVSQFTRVCSYDRAGYGQSDPGPQPRSSVQIARELHALLERSQTPGPYVLVGHSFGGYNVRVYAGLYRKKVSGVVLVDASHEDQAQFQPASVREEARGLRKLAPFVPLLRFFGVLRLRDRFQPATVTGSKLSQADMQEVSALALRPNFLPAVLQEYASLPTLSANQVRSAGDLGDLPLMVLTAGQGAGDKDLDGFRQAWLGNLQPSLARLSRRGQQVVVQDSDHMIPYKDPEAIVRAIHSVWTGALR
jgi:pimeloyl-ACP methyl ester carboxylesterase